jgi:hypothetical protein
MWYSASQGESGVSRQSESRLVETGEASRMQVFLPFHRQLYKPRLFLSSVWPQLSPTAKDMAVHKTLAVHVFGSRTMWEHKVTDQEATGCDRC